MANEPATDRSEAEINDRRRLFYVNQRIRDVRDELDRLRQERDDLRGRLGTEGEGESD
jgi:hypothetical protein